MGIKDIKTETMHIPLYPDSIELTMELRPLLHPLLQQLDHNISEFTFANLFLFRHTHGYRISRLDQEIIILGEDDGLPFFMCPFALPEQRDMDLLFSDRGRLKCASEAQQQELNRRGYIVCEDRDNFDYLYQRVDLAQLKGRKFHKKRNLIKAFINNHEYQAEPLLDEYLGHALQVLDVWRSEHPAPGDYQAAREALEKSWDLQLCGGMYYVEGTPVAYTLGEELGGGSTFVIHFEKAISGYKGLYQFVNQTFAAILPEIYQNINREQDLGDEGLRRAKQSYKPTGFVKKYQVTAPVRS